MIRNYYILIVAAILCVACSEEQYSGTDSSGAVELTTVTAKIDQGSVGSRAGESASNVVYLEDRISRFMFVTNDIMSFTKIERTTNPIKRFQYKDVAFTSNASGAWERNKNTGYNLEDVNGTVSQDKHPERIYWSDATSAHTFVGYSLPKDNSAFDWKKSAYYYDKDGTSHQFDTYYGAIGDPTNATEEIDFNPSASQEPQTETITVEENGVEKSVTFNYSQKLRDEDLLLTYNNALVADNSVANIKFYHALSSVRVIVNISGFYGTATDAYSKVSDMIINNQPTLYRWKQQSTAVDALLTNNENTALSALWTGEGVTAPSYDQRKKLKLWNTNPEGDGTGASKTFTFYGITVPQGDDYFKTFNNDAYKNLEFDFKVTYPDPLKNDPETKTLTKAYHASIANPVFFYPGKCTTIHITLNHKDETMTVGASYQDWEYVETPDEGALKKKNTFLSSTERESITIVGDPKATADDATWLYNKTPTETQETIVDIYGNDGSSTNPYIISTADQLLSFAYEVKNGRDFVHKFVKLDADITLQKQTAMPTKKVKDSDGNDIDVEDRSQLLDWIGIGDDTKDADGKYIHAFNGFFLGNNRHINNLYCQPFFNVVGDNAVIDKIDFNNVIEVHGDGVVANVNNGLICACNIEGDVVQENPQGSTQRYCGSFVGDNKSFIIACTHNGTVAGHGYVGGLVGMNEGTIIASYHTGLVKFAEGVTDPSESNKTDGYNVGGSSGYKGGNSQIFSCYFNGDLIKHTPSEELGKVAFARSTAQMQSNGFVNHASLGENKYYDIVSKETVTIDINNETDFCEKRLCLNDALDVFKKWLDNKSTTGETIKTNCRDFTPQQIVFLQTHYGSAHRFQYTPGAYPKVQ